MPMLISTVAYGYTMPQYLLPVLLEDANATKLWQYEFCTQKYTYAGGVCKKKADFSGSPSKPYAKKLFCMLISSEQGAEQHRNLLKKKIRP